MAKHHFLWQPGHLVHMGYFFVFVEYIHAGDEISKPLFATLYGGRYPPPPPFLRTQTFEKFYNFLNAGLSYITVFVFQAAFKYETRNDQTFTQVKLFDKNIVLFFILLYLIFVVILTA